MKKAHAMKELSELGLSHKRLTHAYAIVRSLTPLGLAVRVILKEQHDDKA